MKELKVQPIKNGTVIDHIKAGTALKILNILHLTEKNRFTVSLLMNVVSKKHEKKDIVKIENREIKPKEVDKVALISPNITINIIRDFEVVRKYKVKLPDKIKGILRCDNPNCITNLKTENIEPVFEVVSKKPLQLRCLYCEREMTNIAQNII